MTRINDLLRTGLVRLGPKPSDDASQSQKKRYSEQASEVIALAFAEELRARGLQEARPALPGMVDRSGAERRMAGGIGAKKVDVTWATEESGLLLGISIKTINFKDGKTGNFQKNLINRRGDMLIEAVTLHRRFPYAVLLGFIFLDKDAENDATMRRKSTFANAHGRLRLFTGRSDPAGRDEQYERMYIGLLDVVDEQPGVRMYRVGNTEEILELGSIFDDALQILAERNPDFYEYEDGKLIKLRS